MLQIFNLQDRKNSSIILKLEIIRLCRKLISRKRGKEPEPMDF